MLKALRRLRHKILNRVPPTTTTMREAKTAHWQIEANFNSFVSNSDATTVPAAAYMDAVVNDFFLSHCPAGAHVLDVGCGHGIVSIFLAQHGMSVTACDVSEPLLQVLNQNSAGLNIKTLRADAYDMPFDDNEFDVVVARMFLFQFPDWPKILREMARCCRRGGQLMIHFTSKENEDLGQESGSYDCDFGGFGATRVGLVPRKSPAAFNGAFDRRSIDKACQKIGLRVVERAPCSFFHYNRLIGHSLGTERFADYRTQLDEYLKDAQVLDFIVWFEKMVVQAMPVWMSHYNILVLEKL
jgi:ubiquinone/menaquinone biosynthesis C-methylase UbiE